MVPTAIVLHGPTSAGKSSLAKALQDSSDVPVFHITLDAFVEMSRRRDMRSEIELAQALEIHHQNLQSTLRLVAKSHFDIVLDLVLRNETEFKRVPCGACRPPAICCWRLGSTRSPRRKRT